MYINTKVSVHHSPCSLGCVILRSLEVCVHQLRVSSLGSCICSPFEGVLSGSYGVPQHVCAKQGCPCLGSREPGVRWRGCPFSFIGVCSPSEGVLSSICSPFEGVLSGSYGVPQHVRVKQGCPWLGSCEACVRWRGCPFSFIGVCSQSEGVLSSPYGVS